MNRKDRRAAAKTGVTPGPAQAPPPLAAMFGRALQLHQAGSLVEAEQAYRQILTLQPNHADALHLLGVALHQMERHDEAIALIRRAIALNGRNAHYHGNLGQVLRIAGRLDEAEASYRRALTLQPDYLDVLMGLGVLMQGKDRPAEATAAYRKALALKPDLAEAHNNLGNALESQGKLAEAIASYERAVALRPQDTGMIYNLASALIDNGEVARALQFAQRGMQIAKTPQIETLLGNCVKEMRGDGGNAELRDLIARALSEPWGRPQDFAAAAIEIAKAEGRYGAADATNLAEAADDQVLQALLENVTIGDLDLERYLTRMRATLLDRAVDTADDKTLRFACALACQCFINDYVYDRSAAEWGRVEARRDALVDAIARGEPVAPLSLAVIASYLPLQSVSHAERLLARPWPEPIAALLTLQLREPARERELAAAMPCLTAIEDRVSQEVRAQYEANPYPRWVKAAPPASAMTVDAYLAKTFPRAALRPLGKGSAIDLLIAGCGTGQHSIETAQLFAGARVLAIDLSRASLAYAKRQSEARGLFGVDYAQADILELGALGRSFDVIESAGVLHHLAEPFAGWRVLLSLLRPGGLMRLAFYSELARRDVVAAREFIASRGFGNGADDIRRARQEIIAAGPSAPFASIIKTSDFYGTSACRDLLFHVQEHRMTLPEIADFLAAEKLRLIGFEADKRVASLYRARFPRDEAMTDLESWHRYETENPATFRGMYQFWVQKEA